MKCLVLAQGAGRRWDGRSGPHLGHPKHFVQIDGETLLERQVRLFRQRGCDVVVVGHDDRYQVDGAALITLDQPRPTGTNMDKFVATAPLWATDDRTIITWGDCYLTDDCADQITRHPDDSYHVWRRPGRSRVTGAKWDESFAVSFGPTEHDRVLDGARRIVALITTGKLTHPKVPGADPSHIRTHLAAMCGVRDDRLDDVARTALLPNQTHVDDWSDDFDTPTEWFGWMRRRFTHDGHRLGVCIPWCGGDKWRTASFEWVSGWFERHDIEVFIGDDLTDGEFPNRSAMRNQAARQAIGAGCDVLFFADSDTFVPSDQMWTAAFLANHQRQMVLAFDRYVRVGRDYTIRLLPLDNPVDNRWMRAAIRRSYKSTEHASGAFAISVDLWNEVGGYDERFIRWGFEDRAFWLTAGTIGGFAQRVHGDAFHWWHPTAVDKDRESAEYQQGAELGRRYKLAAAWAPKAGAMEPLDLPEAAQPDPDAIRNILAEPGGPLAPLVVA